MTEATPKQPTAAELQAMIDNARAVLETFGLAADRDDEDTDYEAAEDANFREFMTG